MQRPTKTALKLHSLVVAVTADSWDFRHVKTTNGDIPLITIQVEHETGFFYLQCWGAHTARSHHLQVGDVLALRRVKTSSYRDRVNLSLTRSSSILLLWRRGCPYDLPRYVTNTGLERCASDITKVMGKGKSHRGVDPRSVNEKQCMKATIAWLRQERPMVLHLASIAATEYRHGSRRRRRNWENENDGPPGSPPTFRKRIRSEKVSDSLTSLTVTSEAETVETSMDSSYTTTTRTCGVSEGATQVCALDTRSCSHGNFILSHKQQQAVLTSTSFSASSRGKIPGSLSLSLRMSGIKTASDRDERCTLDLNRARPYGSVGAPRLRGLPWYVDDNHMCSVMGIVFHHVEDTNVTRASTLTTEFVIADGPDPGDTIVLRLWDTPTVNDNGRSNRSNWNRSSRSIGEEGHSVSDDTSPNGPRSIDMNESMSFLPLRSQLRLAEGRVCEIKHVIARRKPWFYKRTLLPQSKDTGYADIRRKYSLYADLSASSLTTVKIVAEDNADGQIIRQRWKDLPLPPRFLQQKSDATNAGDDTDRRPAHERYPNPHNRQTEQQQQQQQQQQRRRRKVMSQRKSKGDTQVVRCRVRLIKAFLKPQSTDNVERIPRVQDKGVREGKHVAGEPSGTFMVGCGNAHHVCESLVMRDEKNTRWLYRPFGLRILVVQEPHEVSKSQTAGQSQVLGINLRSGEEVSVTVSLPGSAQSLFFNIPPAQFASVARMPELCHGSVPFRHALDLAILLFTQRLGSQPSTGHYGECIVELEATRGTLDLDATRNEASDNITRPRLDHHHQQQQQQRRRRQRQDEAEKGEEDVCVLTAESTEWFLRRMIAF